MATVTTSRGTKQLAAPLVHTLQSLIYTSSSASTPVSGWLLGVLLLNMFSPTRRQNVRTQRHVAFYDLVKIRTFGTL